MLRESTNDFIGIDSLDIKMKFEFETIIFQQKVTQDF